MKNTKGMTLVELLVVLAISVVLMGLLLVPIVKTLEVNRMTAAYTNAQENSRKAMEMLRKDISEAMYVADSDATPILLPVNGLVDSEGNEINTPVVMEYGVINLCMPKTEFYCNNPEHDSQYPRTFGRGDNYSTTGKELAMNKCPYCDTDEYVTVTPKLPVEKSTTVVRYFLGLKDNGASKDPIMTTSDSADFTKWVTEKGKGWMPNDANNQVDADENQLILYRVEFDPIDDNNLFPAEYSLDGLSSNSDEYKFRLNRRITDANVFYHKDCCENWASIVQNVGVIEGLDLALCRKDDYKDGHPYRVKNIISFSPASISGEAPVKNASTTYSQDDQNAPATSFRTKYSLLGNTIGANVVRVNDNEVPQARWILKSLTNSYSSYSNVYAVSDWESLNPNVTDSDIEFDTAAYYNKTYVENYDQKMAFVFDRDKGCFDFALNPIPWKDYTNNYNDNLDKDKFLYYPESDVYSYKFNPYKYATVVPGSETVTYYNAYWDKETSSNVYESFVQLGYNYGNMKDNVDFCKYQRCAFSLGQLSYNQYKIDYNEGVIYWKPILTHNYNLGVYPTKFTDIPRIDYKIQFNTNNDKITLSYVTNQVIDVNLNMSMVWDYYNKPRTGSINERVVVGNSLK